MLPLLRLVGARRPWNFVWKLFRTEVAAKKVCNGGQSEGNIAGILCALIL